MIRPAPRCAPVLVLIAALSLVCLAACDRAKEPPRAASTDTSGRRVVYVCPMNDVPPLPEPGDCPVCGMTLTPLALETEDQAHPARLRLRPGEVLGAGIRTAPVERRFATASVRLYGQIEYDPGYSTQLNAFTSGVIDKLYVRRTGEYIRVNQKLFDFYSAEIYEMELELLEIMRRIPDYVASQLGGSVHPSQLGYPGAQGSPTRGGQKDKRELAPLAPGSAEMEKNLELERRFAAIRFRLRSFGLYDTDINRILRLEEPVGIITVRVPTLTSTVGGVLIANSTSQGQYVNKGTPLMTIADPHFIWANFQAFEADYAWLRFGQSMEFSTPARPGEVFSGKITTIDPVFDQATRTFRIGVTYDDPKTLLRPNMLVRGLAKASLNREGFVVNEHMTPDQAPLVIPDSAPLVTGERAVVYVAVPGEEGVFEARQVVLGPRADDGWVVVSGLSAGETVVVSGAFALDSELQIRARPSMMQPDGLPEAAPAGRHGHGDRVLDPEAPMPMTPKPAAVPETQAPHAQVGMPDESPVAAPDKAAPAEPPAKKTGRPRPGTFLKRPGLPEQYSRSPGGLAGPQPAAPQAPGKAQEPAK